MVSDSIPTAPIPSAANTKNLGKKKRTNRSAKLKQCKIDARREQWLSQGAVKNKGYKDGGDDNHAPPMHARKDGKRSLEELEMRPTGEENDGSIHQDSDLESPSYSPTSVNSSLLGGNNSGTHFTASSSSSSSAGCCSGNITGLDDWEAVADALAADEKHQNLCSETLPEHKTVVQMVSSCEMEYGSNLGTRESKPESALLISPASGNSRAWRPDDAFRPQSLPNLSKQLSLPNPDRHCGGGITWARTAPPYSCPICCEDLDLTDSSFIPCPCGFRLCLFCHKRIIEDDGRCPGCRKPYKCESIETEARMLGGSLTLRLARCCSMIERS
ncbi:CCR4-NOT transcription complex subunit 4 [Senna tora]|uniref:CCR4-NOT transcription complex subunit 4 n=1 Tax=Senna tora TaxID=362788 RepID=A0A834SM97_9FABA|nr:CCR4-NOT transcription complex subunit 4 [Senna tora]